MSEKVHIAWIVCTTVFICTFVISVASCIVNAPPEARRPDDALGYCARLTNPSAFCFELLKKTDKVSP